MQAPLYGSGSQEGTGYMNNQTVLPNSSLHFQAGTPSQPSTPTIGEYVSLVVLFLWQDTHKYSCIMGWGGINA